MTFGFSLLHHKLYLKKIFPPNKFIDKFEKIDSFDNFNSDQLNNIKIIIMYISSLTKKVIYRCSVRPILSQNYQHLQTTYSKDLKTYLHEYTHQGTNARIYHFHNGDAQNAFASVVKTYVENDTGCPHILEHLATCGSHKYPVRDPFFNMIRRSVNTFMNAWTGDDFTSYPFSSANPTDWKNLYNVYLDMSFKASLNELDFRQEGWRYEINAEGKRQLKGIVLNEMKGAYQDSDRQLFKQIFTELFRNTPYVNDSGGRPAQIVNLEYSQLKKMYEHYYHPSNMAFFFYGNNHIEEHLNFLEKEYLSKYKDNSSAYNKVNLKPAPVQNRHKTITSYTSQSNNITINYFIGQYKEILPIQLMALRIVSYILLQKSNALLYKKFIQSGIAQNIGFAGLNEAQLTTFSFTLKGIYSNYECEAFQTAFKQVLQTLIKQGIPQQRLNEYSHQFQINLLTPRQNNGIKVLQQTIALMTHRLNFQLFMSPRTFLNQAVRKLSNPQYLAKIINKFFLNNQQMIVIRQLLAETEIVQTPIQSKLIIDDKIIKEQQQQLSIRQNTKQDNNILPMLKMQDIVKPIRKTPILTNNILSNGKTYQQYHVKIQQEINFYRLIFNYKQVDQKFLKNITLWMFNLNRIISTKSYDYNQLTAELANNTAGFNVSHSIGGNEDFNVIFQFSCLKANKDKAFSLLQQMIFSPKFEKDHTINSYRAFNNQITESIISNPMSECLSQAAGQLTKAGAILNSYQRIKESLSIINNNQIQGLYHTSLEINKCSNIRLIEHSNEVSIQKPKLIDQLLSSNPEPMKTFNFIQKIQPKSVTFTYNVNFCAQQYLAPKFLSKQHAYLNLLLEVLQHEYIHPLIREKGGAYGSNSRVRNNGTISFSSYMDPNSTATFDAFDKSIKAVLQRDNIDDQSLLQAKIKQFGEVDRVKIPQNEGVNQIIRGYSQQQYDQFRETLKTAKFNEIVETGRKYLIDVPKSRCIFGKQTPEGFVEEKLKNFLL